MDQYICCYCSKFASVSFDIIWRLLNALFGGHLTHLITSSAEKYEVPDGSERFLTGTCAVLKTDIESVLALR